MLLAAVTFSSLGAPVVTTCMNNHQVQGELPISSFKSRRGLPAMVCTVHHIIRCNSPTMPPPPLLSTPLPTSLQSPLLPPLKPHPTPTITAAQVAELHETSSGDRASGLPGDSIKMMGVVLLLSFLTHFSDTGPGSAKRGPRLVMTYC